MTTETATLRPGQSLSDLCSLSPAQLEERLAMVRREIRPHMLQRLELEDGLAFEFDASPGMRAKLENLAELERQCCGPLDFSVRTAPDESRLRFEIRGADPKSGVFDGLSLDDPHEPRARPLAGGKAGGLLRFARTGGIAAAASFVLFCVVPIAIVSVVGAGVAAPLLKLDNPWIVGVGALLLGAVLWQFEKRRCAKKLEAERAAAGTCGC